MNQRNGIKRGCHELAMMKGMLSGLSVDELIQDPQALEWMISGLLERTDQALYSLERCTPLVVISYSATPQAATPSQRPVRAA